MARRNLKFVLAGLAFAVMAGCVAWWWYESQKVCCAFPDDPEPMLSPFPAGEHAKLGLMTSLPLYWEAGATMQDIAASEAGVPWQRTVLEQRHDLTPLDTLSPIPGLGPDDAEIDPLAGIERLAVIQPRGLSPQDNVALDEWVQAGGRLLLVLDPMLTGEYPFALGDPRRPADVATIPAVVERWGMTVIYDERQEFEGGYELQGRPVPASLYGQISAAEGCVVGPGKVVARCAIGEGQVTVVVDAAVFEGGEPTPEAIAAIQALVEYAFEKTEA